MPGFGTWRKAWAALQQRGRVCAYFVCRQASGARVSAAAGPVDDALQAQAPVVLFPVAHHQAVGQQPQQSQLVVADGLALIGRQDASWHNTDAAIAGRSDAESGGAQVLQQIGGAHQNTSPSSEGDKQGVEGVKGDTLCGLSPSSPSARFVAFGEL